MSHHSFWTTVILIGLLVYGLIHLREKVTPDAPQQEQASVAEANEEPLLGEHVLKNYMAPSNSLQDDLNLLSALMQSYFTLVKTHARHPMSVNEDVVEALLGKNPAKEVFLGKDHPAINDRGQLIDRYGSALFFHAVGAGHFEIRSAGPDKALWTEDDLQRQPSGEFAQGSPANGVLFP